MNAVALRRGHIGTAAGALSILLSGPLVTPQKGHHGRGPRSRCWRRERGRRAHAAPSVCPLRRNAPAARADQSLSASPWATASTKWWGRREATGGGVLRPSPACSARRTSLKPRG